MSHDHAASERRRQEDEYKGALSDLTTERQVNLLLYGALQQIRDNPGLGAHNLARDALAGAQKLRGR